VVGEPEDKDDQPDTEDAQGDDEQAAQQAFEQSHDPATIKRSLAIASIIRRF
jgi:hypothetical protein